MPLVVGAILSGALALESRAASLIGLGDFDGGSYNSRGLGVSPDASVVVGRGNSGSGNVAFRWTQARGLVQLPTTTGGIFPGQFNEAYAVSQNGGTVVGASRSFLGEGVLWTQAGGTLVIGCTLPPPNDGGCIPSTSTSPIPRTISATGVSADGSVVVGFGGSVPAEQGFRWDQRSGSFIGFAAQSEAFGISASGFAVVGWVTTTHGREAFLWTQATGLQGLGDLPGGNFSSQALDVSADGSAVVGVSRSGRGDEAFLWTQTSGMMPLGVDTEAHGVSAQGVAVVGVGDGAFYWTQTGGLEKLRDVLAMQGVDVSAWLSLDVAYDISPDGTAIVGYGTRDDPANGNPPEAFLVRDLADGDQDGVSNATDNCPYFATTVVTDADSDGRGDACECTDQNGDGFNTVADLVAINLAIIDPLRVTPLCDGNGDGRCDAADIMAATIELYTPTSTSTCPRNPLPGV